MWLVWMVVILVSIIKSRGVKQGEAGDRIFTSDGEKQSVEGSQLPKTGSNSVRNNSVVDGTPRTQP